ncbi:MAG: ankyrin repeat domain-containing protein [Cyclobacteriaceae bacterium]
MSEEQHPYFQKALDALDGGDLEALSIMIDEHPDLVKAKYLGEEDFYGGYFWRPTLLHHIAGNPIRGPLPENIVKITRALLEAGADVNATCGGGPNQPNSGGATVLGLLVSGKQAHEHGVTEQLLDILLKAGAKLNPDGKGGAMWIALYHTVEHQGQREVAQMLYDRGHPVDFCYAAGLGLQEKVQSYFDEDGRLKPDADLYYRHQRPIGAAAREQDILNDALMFATVTNAVETATLLLDKGAEINTPRQWGGYEVVTPLHLAAWAGWKEITQLLLDRGADHTLKDDNHNSTPAVWAQYCGHLETWGLLLKYEK